MFLGQLGFCHSVCSRSTRFRGTEEWPSEGLGKRQAWILHCKCCWAAVRECQTSSSQHSLGRKRMINSLVNEWNLSAWPTLWLRKVPELCCFDNSHSLASVAIMALVRFKLLFFVSCVSFCAVFCRYFQMIHKSIFKHPFIEHSENHWGKKKKVFLRVSNIDHYVPLSSIPLWTALLSSKIKWWGGCHYWACHTAAEKESITARWLTGVLDMTVVKHR